MTDFFDRAQALEQQQRDMALAAQAEASRVSGAGYSHCRDCGDTIPPARRLAAAGCTRCLDCQTRQEHGR